MLPRSHRSKRNYISSASPSIAARLRTRRGRVAPSRLSRQVSFLRGSGCDLTSLAPTPRSPHPCLSNGTGSPASASLRRRRGCRRSRQWWAPPPFRAALSAPPPCPPTPRAFAPRCRRRHATALSANTFVQYVVPALGTGHRERASLAAAGWGGGTIFYTCHGNVASALYATAVTAVAAWEAAGWSRGGGGGRGLWRALDRLVTGGEWSPSRPRRCSCVWSTMSSSIFIHCTLDAICGVGSSGEDGGEDTEMRAVRLVSS